MRGVLGCRREEWVGGIACQGVERGVGGGTSHGGTVGLVRAGSAAVRRGQTGFLRYYAAAMVAGVFAVGLYFLISAS